MDIGPYEGPCRGRLTTALEAQPSLTVRKCPNKQQVVRDAAVRIDFPSPSHRDIPANLTRRSIDPATHAWGVENHPFLMHPDAAGPQGSGVPAKPGTTDQALV